MSKDTTRLGHSHHNSSEDFGPRKPATIATGSDTLINACPETPNSPHSLGGLDDTPRSFSHFKIPGISKARREPSTQGYRYDYEQKYPEDPYGEEVGSNARVWRTFSDEAGLFDAEMVENWKDSLDVLLVFRAAANGTSFDTIPSSPLNPDSGSTATLTDKVVNGLWFTSLSFSLSAALVAVLVKQWIQQYVSGVSGTPLDQVRIRQFRFLGFRKWKVPIIIGMLPVFLHISLLLYFLGLVVFLSALNTSIATIVIVISGISYIAYFLVNLLPLRYIQCPYKTPLSDYAFLLVGIVSQLMARWRHFIQTSLSFGANRDRDIPAGGLRWKSLKEAELATIRECTDELDAEALSWLYSTSSNPTVGSVVLQAISGLQVGFGSKHILQQAGLNTSIRRAFMALFTHHESSMLAHLKPGMLGKAERLARSRIQLQPVSDDDWRERKCFQALVAAGSSLGSLEARAVGHALVQRTADGLSYGFARLLPMDDILQYYLAEEPRHHPYVWISILRCGIVQARTGATAGTYDWRSAVKLLRHIPISFWSLTYPLSPDNFHEQIKLHLLIEYLFYSQLPSMAFIPWEEPDVSSLEPVEYTLDEYNIERFCRPRILLIRFIVKVLSWLSNRSRRIDELRNISSTLAFHAVYTKFFFEFASENTENINMKELRDTMKDLQDALLHFLESDTFLDALDSDTQQWCLVGYRAVGQSSDVPLECTRELMSRLLCVNASQPGVHTLLKDWFSHGDPVAYMHFTEEDGILACAKPWNDGQSKSFFSAPEAKPEGRYSLLNLQSYVLGLFQSDLRLDRVALNRHLDYVHRPDNLAALCCALAQMEGAIPASTDPSSTLLIRLTRLRPRDPAWIPTITSLVACTRSHQDFHYTERHPNSRSSTSDSRNYYDRFLLLFSMIEELQRGSGSSTAFVCADFTMYEYVSGATLRNPEYKLSPDLILIDGLPIYAPYAIVFRPDKTDKAYIPTRL